MAKAIPDQDSPSVTIPPFEVPLELAVVLTADAAEPVDEAPALEAPRVVVPECEEELSLALVPLLVETLPVLVALELVDAPVEEVPDYTNQHSIKRAVEASHTLVAVVVADTPVRTALPPPIAETVVHCEDEGTG